MRRPPGSTTASPQVASCCVGDFLAANSTFTNWPAAETGLCLLFLFPLPLLFQSKPLFQMAIQRAEAQTPTLAKLAPPHTATHKIGHQLLNFRSSTSLGRC